MSIGFIMRTRNHLIRTSNGCHFLALRLKPYKGKRKLLTRMARLTRTGSSISGMVTSSIWSWWSGTISTILVILLRNQIWKFKYQKSQGANPHLKKLQRANRNLRLRKVQVLSLNLSLLRKKLLFLSKWNRRQIGPKEIKICRPPLKNLPRKYRPHLESLGEVVWSHQTGWEGHHRRFRINWK